MVWHGQMQPSGLGHFCQSNEWYATCATVVGFQSSSSLSSQWTKHETVEIMKPGQMPQCHQSPEMHDHVFQCQAPEAVKMWEQALEKLEDWMKETKTFPQFSKQF